MRDTNGSQPVEQSPDQTALRLRATIGEREEFTFRTGEGIESPESFRAPELRLLDVLTEDPPNTLLVTDANYGVVGIVMACFANTVWMTETSTRAATFCRNNARLNGVDAQTSVAITADPQALPATFDAAAFAPTGYTPAEVVEQRMADTIATLNANGEIYLAATPRTGLKRYTRTLRDLCNDVSTIDGGSECTVIRATRPKRFDPPLYAEPRTIQPEVNGITLSLVTYPGLFSASNLDDGTRALAESLEVANGEHVLDLACGYGQLGIYSARTADCTVSLTDDNCVATACACRSANQSDVTDAVEVVTADGITGVRKNTFDRIVCNPPTHAGSSTLHALMREASEVLSHDGQMNLVHHQGVSFSRYLNPYFDSIESTDRGEYHVVTVLP